VKSRVKPPHSKARFAREKFAASSIRRFAVSEEIVIGHSSFQNPSG
jgi:hypothetical protein